MPTVYVIPPEEDLEEPWCFFDAEYRDGVTSESSSQLELAADVARGALQLEPPVFHRDFWAEGVVMPRRSGDVLSLLGAEEESEDEYEDYGQDITIRGNEPGDFSEVIEVITVKRRGDTDAPKPSTTPKRQTTYMKRSETFLSKASRAFRSLKNINRPQSSGITRPHVGEVFSPRESTKSQTSTMTSSVSSISSTQDSTTATVKRHISRRGSMVLSQMFTTSPTSMTREVSDTYPSPSILASRPSSSSLFTSSIHPDILRKEEIAMDRSSSPTPSTRRSSIRRFSVLNLFSRSSDGLQQAEPSLPSMSRESLTPSSVSTSSSSSGPPTPVNLDERLPPPVPPKGAVPLLKRIPSFMRKDKGDPPTKARIPPQGAEISFEMRLDSLHFDELTFDANQFR